MEGKSASLLTTDTSRGGITVTESRRRAILKRTELLL
jgi:hypothetical protein